ncbi:hypothetical protein N7449_007687 [Penicillium cf. viridicatum]|uniref:Uncharacterized protein n=1 Tax=Penicillium cf. viridicatum TaxID=2972119 RepID=A0A9W9JHY2_9EURO|nr:hypothetical protein N7449_007687 [Penicillium cf. viridicatum]
MATTVGLRNSKIAFAGNAVVVNCGVTDGRDPVRQPVRCTRFRSLLSSLAAVTSPALCHLSPASHLQIE